MIGWFTWFRGRDGNAHLPADESYPNSRGCQQSRAIPPSELQAISRAIGKGRGEVGFRGRWSGRDRPGPLPGVRGLIMRLVGTILMPTGQAYEVYNDHPGADPGDVEKIASLVSKASAAGKPVFFSDGYRVLAVQPAPPMGVVKSPPLSDADRKRIAALWESAGRSAGPIVTLPNQCEVRPDGTVFVPRGADPATWLAAFAAPLADDAPVSVVEGSP